MWLEAISGGGNTTTVGDPLKVSLGFNLKAIVGG